MKKREIIRIGIEIGLITGSLYLFGKNRKQAGIIQNQDKTIKGLLKEVKNLSYHLGKK